MSDHFKFMIMFGNTHLGTHTLLCIQTSVLWWNIKKIHIIWEHLIYFYSCFQKRYGRSLSGGNSSNILIMGTKWRGINNNKVLNSISLFPISSNETFFTRVSKQHSDDKDSNRILATWQTYFNIKLFTSGWTLVLILVSLSVTFSITGILQPLHATFYRK